MAMSTMIERLVELPADVVRSSVYTLLTVMDLVRLDSAVLAHSFRGQLFHATGSHTYPSIQLHRTFHNNLRALQWMVQKGLTAGDLTLNDNFGDVYTFLAEHSSFMQGNLGLCFRTEGATTLGLPVPSVLERRVHRLCWRVNRGSATAGLHCSRFRDLKMLNWIVDGNTYAPLVGILQSNFHLEDVSIVCQEALAAGVCNALALSGATLRELYLCTPGISKADLMLIGQHCNSLITLGFVTWFYVELHKVDEDGLRAIAQGCAALQDLVLRHCDVSETAAAIVLGEMHNLRWCSMDNAVLTDNALHRLARHMPPLDVFPSMRWKVTSVSAAQSCAAVWGRLQSIRITLTEQASPPAVAAAIRCMSQLRNLRLETDLRVHSTSCVSAELIAAASVCAQLEVLTCECVAGNIQDALLALVVNTPQLRTLQVSTNGEGCVSDSVLHALASHCPGLSGLYLPCSKGVSDAGVVALLSGCAHLQQLSLRGAVSLTDRTLNAIVQYRPPLKILSLGQSALLTEDAIRRVVDQSASKLTLLVPEVSLSAEAVARFDGKAYIKTIPPVGDAAGQTSTL